MVSDEKSGFTSLKCYGGYRAHLLYFTFYVLRYVYVLRFTFYVVVVLDYPGRVPRRTSVPGETAILSSISIGPGRVPQQCVVVCPLGIACTAV